MLDITLYKLGIDRLTLTFVVYPELLNRAGCAHKNNKYKLSVAD